MAAHSELTDIDATETQEWIDSLQSVIERDGIERAHFLLTSLMDHARESGASLPFSVNTPYLNTIPESRAEHTPGDPAIEWRIRSLIRWNALAMVVQANRLSSELGGHIASFASAATLYDVGFNHFWHAPNEAHGGDLIFMQGHSAPGIYARAFLEGRITPRPPPPVPPGDRRRRALLVPASVAHARLLAVSHGVHGSRPHHGHLSRPGS